MSADPQRRAARAAVSAQVAGDSDSDDKPRRLAITSGKQPLMLGSAPSLQQARPAPPLQPRTATHPPAAALRASAHRRRRFLKSSHSACVRLCVLRCVLQTSIKGFVASKLPEEPPEFFPPPEARSGEAPHRTAPGCFYSRRGRSRDLLQRPLPPL